MDGAVESDKPVPERPETGRVAALARLLHRDCTRLLELYNERESFPAPPVASGERLVSLSGCADAQSAVERVGHVHSALRGCLELLDCLMRRELEEMGEELQGEYESLRRTVQDRLAHLLHSTAALLEDTAGDCQPDPDVQCSEGQDEVEGSGSFAAKLWTYRVLLELIHWTESACLTLHTLHTETQQQQQQQIL